MKNIVSNLVKIEEKDGKTVFNFNLDDTIMYNKNLDSDDDFNKAINTCIKMIKNIDEYSNYVDELQTLLVS